MRLKLPSFNPTRVFYGWWVVVACSIIAFLEGGIHFFNSSVLFLPVMRDLGLSRAATALVLSLARAEGGILGPGVGWLIDHWGARRMIVAGTIVAVAGYLFLAQIHSYWGFLVVYLAVVAVGVQAGLWAPLSALVNNWFVRRRGLAMAIVMSIFMGGSAVLVPVLAALVYSLGWRTAVVVLAVSIPAIVLPLSLIIRSTPESLGLKPDGQVKDEATPPRRADESATSADFTVKQALKSLNFWVLVIAINLQSAVFGIFVIHFIPLMVWKGLGEQQAAYLLGVWSFLGIPARLFLGWLGDRWSKPGAVALGLGVGIAAPLIWLYGGTGWELWTVLALFALVVGVFPLGPTIVADFYGRKNFATIWGILGFLTMLGSSLAPIVAGLIYDRSQSYALVLKAEAGLLVGAAFLFALLRWPRMSHAA